MTKTFYLHVPTFTVTKNGYSKEGENDVKMSFMDETSNLIRDEKVINQIVKMYANKTIYMCPTQHDLIYVDRKGLPFALKALVFNNFTDPREFLLKCVQNIFKQPLYFSSELNHSKFKNRVTKTMRLFSTKPIDNSIFFDYDETKRYDQCVFRNAKTKDIFWIMQNCLQISNPHLVDSKKIYKKVQSLILYEPEYTFAISLFQKLVFLWTRESPECDQFTELKEVCFKTISSYYGYKSAEEFETIDNLAFCLMNVRCPIRFLDVNFQDGFRLLNMIPSNKSIVRLRFKCHYGTMQTISFNSQKLLWNNSLRKVEFSNGTSVYDNPSSKSVAELVYVAETNDFFYSEKFRRICVLFSSLFPSYVLSEVICFLLVSQRSEPRFSLKEVVENEMMEQKMHCLAIEKIQSVYKSCDRLRCSS